MAFLLYYDSFSVGDIGFLYHILFSNFGKEQFSVKLSSKLIKTSQRFLLKQLIS